MIFSRVLVLGKSEIMESELLLTGEHLSENENRSESQGPCNGLSSSLGCKRRCTCSAVLPPPLAFSLTVMRTALACSRQMVPWPAVAPTTSFPTAGGRTHLYHHNCVRSNTSSYFFHPSPCLVHAAQIIPLTPPFFSLVHARGITYDCNSL